MNLTNQTLWLLLGFMGIKIIFALLALAVSSAVAQIKPGEWNGHKAGITFPGLSITLYESGEAVLGYVTQEVEVMAQGTWELIKDGKFAGDALVRLDIEYVKRGEVVSYQGSIDPIYLSQSGDHAYIVKGVSVDEIDFDISFPLKHTGHRHIKITEGNH